jgi:hypothetical protein
LLDEVPALEVRNGAMLPAQNLLLEKLAIRWRRANGEPRLAMIGGSDAHTLRRVGLTWTEAPGRNQEEFLDSLKRGLCAPGGGHGGTLAVAGDTYGVVFSFMGSLMGFGPRDHAGVHRAGCVLFAGASLPCQFLPAAIAFSGKRAEIAAVRDATTRLQSLLADEPPRRLDVEEARL